MIDHIKKNNTLAPPEPGKRATGQPVQDARPKHFPIVGFGASAGGIEAFMTLLQHLDPNLGMAYVLVMHLSPNHKSSLAKVLQTKTTMPVNTVKDGMEVKANNVYVIPPNTLMSMVDGHLKLGRRELPTTGNFEIDFFLTALASIYKNNAIGVILSGTATDGTLGVKAIKAEGGITFAQDETAKFSGMPRSAYECGYVDFLLPPKEIAKELERLVNVPYTRLPSDKIQDVQLAELNDQTDELRIILSIVKKRTGIDFFSNYKHASIYRRVVRRMVLNKFEVLADYTTMVKAMPREVDALYNDFLINVTSFYRDPDFYRILSSDVFPSFTRGGKRTDPVRIWVAGCSTGEEAYSIAICLLEFLEEKGISIPVQIFASDLDDHAIEQARLGIYPTSAVQGVSKPLLKKYFTRVDGQYQINQFVRELCIFSKQDLLKDPPFSRMDLISCQNVLIYLEANPQARILQTFHFSLKTTGFLCLGKSESLGSAADLFVASDRKIKLFSPARTGSPRLSFDTRKTRTTPSSLEQHPSELNLSGDVEKDIAKLILSQYVPPCILVNKNLTIVQFFGVIAPYLEPATGKASLHVLKIIKQELVIHLGSLLQRARKTETVVSKEDVAITINNIQKSVTIEIAPKKQAAGEILFLVVFKEHYQPGPHQNVGKGESGSKIGSRQRTIVTLEQQLSESRDLIRASNEEYETTYEELQAYNEEILSSNEELQSVNEQLETSKEELQSVIEELTTTNEELRKRNIDYKQSQSYAEAIVETVQNPLLVLTSNFQVRMANRAFYQTFKLKQEETEDQFLFELGGNAWAIPSLRDDLNELLIMKSDFKDFEIKHLFQGLGELVLDINAYRLFRSGDKDETLILLAFNNLSDLLKANRELKRANEQLTEFTFIASHDLQEPLRKIQAFSSSLLSPEANLNDYAKDYSQKINASSSRMSMLVKDLLSFSLLSLDDKKLVTVDLNETLKHVLVDLEEVITGKAAVVNVSSLPKIHGVPVQMSQLFYNLLNNALKFGKESIVINVTAEEVSDQRIKDYELNTASRYVAIAVSDNGIGFDQKYMSKLFMLFQRLHPRKGTNGSGVGLAICKKIVEDHRGIILATGKVNEGSTFTVILPV